MHTSTFTEPPPSVADFFELLGDAMSGARPETVAQFWEAPAVILSDAAAQVVSSPAELRAFYARLAEATEAQGVVETRPEIEEELWLSARLVEVQVRWANLSSEGNELSVERARYVLRVDDHGALRIRSMSLATDLDAERVH